MKRLFVLLCCLVLAGCTKATTIPETSPDLINNTPIETISTSQPQLEISIYSGNANANGFESTIYKVQSFDSNTLIEKMTEEGTLNEKIALLSEEYDGTCLHLDFNNAFRDFICSTGTAGEYMIIGSVVNTFLDNYQDVAQSVYITVEGKTLESGHVIYDFELGYHE